MKKVLILVAILAAFPAVAQNAPQSNTLGDGSTVEQQVIGDTNVSDTRNNSQATQLGNSANNNGAQNSNVADTRDQNTVTSTGGAATGGAAIGNQSDNRSGASNGNQSLDGRSQVGNVGSSSGGNITGGNTTGGNTMTGGANTAQGGQGGQGGAASSNGTVTGINGQQQGIDRSGNSANANTNTAAQGQGQGQGQQQANNGTNAQGQTSANRNSQSTQAGNGAGASAGAGAGAGAGSGNKTANTTRVDASDRSSTSYEAKTTVWAPVIHGAAAPALAAANLVVLPGVCGPRVWVERVPVVGKRFGVWGGQSDVEQGYDEAIRPEADPFVQRGAYLIGHQVTQFTAVIGTSSAGSFSLGGYGKNGDGAQGGGAASGQLQQIVSKVQVRECVMAQPKVEIAVPFIERPAIVDRSHGPAPRADRN